MFREEELGMYTMYTGQGDPYKLANIAAFNNKTFLGKLYLMILW